MKVRELLALLKTVNPDADIIVDVNGGTEYWLDTEETEEQNDPTELGVCDEYRLIGWS